MPDASKLDYAPPAPGDPPPGAFGRAWLAVPGWAFQATGAIIFLGYVAARLPGYFSDFNRVGTFFVERDGTTWYAPWGQVLIDLNFLLIGLAFIFRAPAKRVVSRPRDIVIPVIAAFWPMAPFWVLAIVRFLGSPSVALIPAATSTEYYRFMFDWPGVTLTRFLISAGMVILGNAIDVWGYATLFRSISIVPEARVLKTGGPYRFVRHPVYFGQLIAQAGVWLVLAQTHVVWIGFYLCFAAMQLFRSRIEEEVLERHFGDEYRAYRKRALWFWR